MAPGLWRGGRNAHVRHPVLAAPRPAPGCVRSPGRELAVRTGLDTWRVESGSFPHKGAVSEKLHFLVNYAVLAPSKYNAQPWLFEICGESLDVIRDRSWAFRETDPEGRELTLSCGAALFNLRVAARHFGYETRIQTLPWPGDRYLLARVHLERVSPAPRPGAPPRPGNTGRSSSTTAGGQPTSALATDALFEAMKRRCTSRRSFRRRVPPAETVKACGEAAVRHGAWFSVIEDKSARWTVADLVTEGGREQMASRTLRRELARWVHGPLGPSRDGFPVSRYGLHRALDWLSPGLSLALWAFNLGSLIAARDRRLVRNAPVLAVLGTETDDPQSWLAAGQALESVLLHATAAGLSISFFNQAIEVPRLRTELSRLTGRGGFPQILLSLGYGRPARHTPRRPAKEVVI